MTANDYVMEPCRNCGDETPGHFCPNCGQRKGEVRVSMRRLLADVLEDQLSINSALPRTLGALLFHPGRLTVEYSSGRIASYIAPFRLYLVSSLLFFLTLSIISRTAQFEVNDRRGAPLADSVTAQADTPRVALDSSAASSLPDSSAAVQSESPSSTRRQFGIYLSDENMQGDSIDWSAAVHTGSALLDSVVASRARRLGNLPPEQAVRALAGGILQNAPTAMFLLLPVFALLLKILFLGSRRYYVEHFVFALHFHAFMFMLFTPIVVLPDRLRPGLLLIWPVLYLPIALKRVYGQGLVRTLLKWSVLSVGYLFLLVFTIFGTAVATFLLL